MKKDINSPQSAMKANDKAPSGSTPKSWKEKEEEAVDSEDSGCSEGCPSSCPICTDFRKMLKEKKTWSQLNSEVNRGEAEVISSFRTSASESHDA